MQATEFMTLLEDKGASYYAFDRDIIVLYYKDNDHMDRIRLTSGTGNMYLLYYDECEMPVEIKSISIDGWSLVINDKYKYLVCPYVDKESKPYREIRKRFINNYYEYSKKSRFDKDKSTSFFYRYSVEDYEILHKVFGVDECRLDHIKGIIDNQTMFEVLNERK